MDIQTFRTNESLTQAAFAELVSQHGESASQGLVSQWESGKVELSAERCVQIERATDGRLRRSDLRPDLWPTNVAA